MPGLRVIRLVERHRNGVMIDRHVDLPAGGHLDSERRTTTTGE